MQTSPDGPRRTPPVPALLAAPLALVTALAVGFFSVLAVAFSNGQFDDGGWLVVLLPTVLAVGLGLGVILLLLGRSWLVLTVLAGALVAVLLGGELIGTWDTGTVVPVAALFPAGAAVLAALPGVRHLVRRPAGGTNPPLTGPPRGPSFSRSPASYLRGRNAPVWSGGTGPS